MTQPIFGGIEAGGTKFICVVGRSPDEIMTTAQFPTRDPQTTLKQAVDFFREQETERGKLAAIGIASFGPLDLDPSSPSYGSILPTPKPGWSNVNFAGYLREGLGVPVAIDTDVNVAAFGEWLWGAGQGLDQFIYLTIGTGIGGGGVIHGRMMHGLTHPEMGHIRLPQNTQHDDFAGICPYHGNCLEGLASGPAIEKRWGQKGDQLPASHPAWKLEAHYLGLGLVNLICCLSPQRIILGGGVMIQRQLFPLIHAEVIQHLNEYIQSDSIQKNIATYIVPPGLGNRSGTLGAIAMAREQIWS
jgi:fructokinase